MKIQYVLRKDATAKPGGDTGKVYKYASLLTEHGIDVSVTTDPNEIHKVHPDIVHLINLDLPFENVRAAQVALHTGAKIFLSTVHHPWQGVDQYARVSDDRFYAFTRKCGIQPDTAVGLRELTKLISRRSAVPLSASIRTLGATRRAQRLLLDSTDVIATMAPSEELAVREGLNWRGTSVYTPNGMTFKRQTKKQPSDYKVAIIGRIEPRKNTLQAARLLDRLGISTVIAGQPNSNHAAYTKDFIDLTKKSPFLKYLGIVGPEAVRDTLSRSDVSLNPSWFEVVSQADFEAASVGCRVISTRWSYLSDFFPHTVLSPEKLLAPGAEDYLLTLLNSATSVGEALPELSWDDTTERLIGAYKEALAT